MKWTALDTFFAILFGAFCMGMASLPVHLIHERYPEFIVANRAWAIAFVAICTCLGICFYIFHNPKLTCENCHKKTPSNEAKRVPGPNSFLTKCYSYSWECPDCRHSNMEIID